MHTFPSHCPSLQESPLQGPYVMYNMYKALLTPGLPQAAAQSSFHLSPLEKRGKESEPKRLPDRQSSMALETDTGKGPGTSAAKAGRVPGPG